MHGSLVRMTPFKLGAITVLVIVCLSSVEADSAAVATWKDVIIGGGGYVSL